MQPGGHPSPALSPSPADRARFELLADPWRSNMIIADCAACHVDTVHRARRELEAAGAIDTVGAWDRKRRPGSGRGDQYRPAGHQDHDAQRIELPRQPASMAADLCVTGGHDPELWHPGRYDNATRTRALAICGRCPALADCRAWALALPASDKYAIYGGMTANQRAQAQRQRARRNS